jgi:hypothetical protein
MGTKLLLSKKLSVNVNRAVLGMAAGGLGQLFASPADLIKIRLQVHEIIRTMLVIPV